MVKASRVPAFTAVEPSKPSLIDVVYGFNCHLEYVKDVTSLNKGVKC